MLVEEIHQTCTLFLGSLFHYLTDFACSFKINPSPQKIKSSLYRKLKWKTFLPIFCVLSLYKLKTIVLL